MTIYDKFALVERKEKIQVSNSASRIARGHQQLFSLKYLL